MTVISMAAARERRREAGEIRARTALRNALAAAHHVPMHRLARAVFAIEEASCLCSDRTLDEVYNHGSDAERRMLLAVIGEERLLPDGMPVVYYYGD